MEQIPQHFHMEIAFDFYDISYSSLYVVFNAGLHCMRLLKNFLHYEGLVNCIVLCYMIQETILYKFD